MDKLFPRRTAIVSGLLTLSLITSLFWGLSETISQLRQIQKNEIPILETTAIILKLQEHLRDHMEMMVRSIDVDLSPSFQEDRETLVAQISDYKQMLFLVPEYKEFEGMLKNRISLNTLEDDLLLLLKNKSVRREQLGTKLEDYLRASTDYVQPFRDIAEALSQKRDHELQQKVELLYLFVGGALATLTVIILLWFWIFRAYKTNLIEKEKAVLALDQERARAIENAKMVTLGEMAGGIAHEINNPLSIMLIVVQAIRDGIKGPQIDVVGMEKHLVKMVSMTQRIAKIVKGLRSFSRDGTDDPFVPNDLNAIIEDTVELSKGKCKDNGVILKLHPEQYRVTFDCRAVQISQVVMNLISNSVDALREQKEKWIEITALTTETDLQLCITDSGKGIPVEVAKKIFNPFYTTKKVGEGTGLGLSISLGIVASHSGVLKLNTDTPNTQFVLTIPLKQDEGLKLIRDENNQTARTA